MEETYFNVNASQQMTIERLRKAIDKLLITEMRAQIGNAAVALLHEDFKAHDFYTGRSDALVYAHADIMEILDKEKQALIDMLNGVEIED